MNNWLDLDFDKTIRDFEYTRRAAWNMDRIVNSKEFENMDADVIFSHLLRELNLISFGGYLKRYIYMKAGIEDPFSAAPDKEYQDIILQSFQENHAPLSFSPQNKKRPSETVKGWLRQDSVRRPTIFLLGFGLRMSTKDVSEFLTKCIREEDFRFTDPEELTYWYCYHEQLQYVEAKKILDLYRIMDPRLYKKNFLPKSWEEIQNKKDFEKNSREYLYAYLANLKDHEVNETQEEIAYQEYMRLYEHCREIMAGIRQQDEQEKKTKRIWTKEDIDDRDIEDSLCCGIPLNEKGNLEKASRSLLARHFQQKRLSRQKIHDTRKKKIPVERFDLITLLFYIYSQEVEPDWPTERYLKYIEEMNQILTKCRMLELYPANPYEAFVLMCLLSDEPLSIYTEVWELSYTQDNM